MLLYSDVITDDELFSDAFPVCVGLWLISLYAHMLTFGSLFAGRRLETSFTKWTARTSLSSLALMLISVRMLSIVMIGRR